MKKDIHPEYTELQYTMTDGKVYTTRSCKGGEINLDVDPLSHPAWQGGTQKVVERGQLDKFQSRFGSFVSSGSDDAK
jgi:large subunit ribosomal protein L31